LPTLFLLQNQSRLYLFNRHLQNGLAESDTKIGVGRLVPSGDRSSVQDEIGDNHNPAQDLRVFF